MPCRDPDWDIPEVTKSFGMDIHDFEAVLCGMLTVLEKEERMFSLDDVDWSEVGVSRKMVETWWEGHKREDERRRKKEAAEKRKAELRAAALNKLTNEEKEALGIR
jgi:hypothetical protein